jgi:2',3'-cyclic-nucleotide 2'-phosphodiesterase (5'-nucleotidase family)
MRRVSGLLQASLMGLAILLLGTVGVLAMNGQLHLTRLQPTWKLTVVHTNDVLGYVDPCG